MAIFSNWPLRVVPMAALAATLAACAAPPAPLVMVPEAAGIGRSESILVASARAPDPGPAIYSNERAEHLTFTRFEVTIPPAHRPGHFAQRRRAVPDPARDFLVTAGWRLRDEAAFVAALNAAARDGGPAGRRGGIFVHGYRNSFPEGLLYQAQLQHDLDRHGPVVHFAWPTMASTTTYLRDVDSALASREALAQTIRLVAQSEVEEITLVGSSLGAFLLMETLRTMAGGEVDRDVFARLHAVVLVGADIDVDVFRREAAPILARGVPIVVTVSGRDRALRLSSLLRGGEARLGQVSDPAALDDLELVVIDVTDLAVEDRNRHFLLARSPDFIRFVRAIHQEGHALVLSTPRG